MILLEKADDYEDKNSPFAIIGLVRDFLKIRKTVRFWKIMLAGTERA